MTIRFVQGTWTAFGRQRHGWHWENEDGTHHRCGDFVQIGENKLDMEWRAAMERDDRQTAASSRQFGYRCAYLWTGDSRRV